MTDGSLGHGTQGAVSGAIIAGGASRRLGSDKRLVTIAGTTLLARTADVLAPLVDDLQVVIGRTEDRELVRVALGGGPPEGRDVTVSVDARPGIGPVAGLEAALAGARHPLVLVVATDHPLLVPAVLELLVARAHASSASAVALDGPKGPEPFLAVYRRAALGPLRAAIDGGTRRMQELLGALEPELVDADDWRALDPTGRTLADVDVPADLERLAEGLTQGLAEPEDR
jgi:molybdopterin-guanine dinucleotide biosynthesis protein A